MYDIPCPVFPLLLRGVFYSSSQTRAGKKPLSRFFYMLLQGKINSCFQFAFLGLQMYANYPFSLLMENWERFKCTFVRRRPKSMGTCPFWRWALCCPEHSTMPSPPFMLTLKAFSDFSRALQKARRQRLNPSEIQEHYVSFWSSNDAKDNIWADLRPSEGWGTSERGDRNYIIHGKFIVLLRRCSIYSDFLPFVF